MFAETCSYWTFPANVTLYFSIICFRKILNVLNRSNYKKEIGKIFYISTYGENIWNNVNKSR